MNTAVRVGEWWAFCSLVFVAFYSKVRQHGEQKKEKKNA